MQTTPPEATVQRAPTDINVGTDVKLISKWLGHESVAVTLEHYGNWNQDHADAGQIPGLKRPEKSRYVGLGK
jgi:hypothetical protein